MLFGASLSLVGCIVRATGQSITQMIASGAILGKGSGFQEMCYACIQEIVPNNWRIYAIGKKLSSPKSVLFLTLQKDSLTCWRQSASSGHLWHMHSSTRRPSDGEARMSI